MCDFLVYIPKKNMIVGTIRQPISIDLLAPIVCANIPKAVEVIRSMSPVMFVNIIVISVRRMIMEVPRIL